MTRVLLTVSGVMDPKRPEQVRRGERPRADYLELARALDADLLDHAGRAPAGGPVGWSARRGCSPRAFCLPGQCFRRRGRYEVIFTDSEQVGIPLAWLLKYFGGRQQPRHLMIAHILSVGRKLLFFDAFRLQSHIDLFLVYSSWQARFIQERLRVPPERVVLTPFMVDSCFFAPDQVAAGRQRTAWQGMATGFRFVRLGWSIATTRPSWPRCATCLCTS